MNPNVLYPVLWLVLAVILAIAEAATVQLVSIWFALGAAITALLSLTGLPPAIQFACFVLISCVALLLSRPLAHRLLGAKQQKTNADAVVGMEGIVTEPIDNLHEQGRVLVNGLSWSARSAGGEAIEKDQTVRVEKIDGVKLIVRKLSV